MIYSKTRTVLSAVSTGQPYPYGASSSSCYGLSGVKSFDVLEQEWASFSPTEPTGLFPIRAATVREQLCDRLLTRAAQYQAYESESLQERTYGVTSFCLLVFHACVLTNPFAPTKTPLVQAVIRDGLREEEKRLWTTAAVRLLEKAFPSLSYDTQTWPTCARLLPHALVAARHAEGFLVRIEETGRLLNQAGLYVRGRARFAEAEELYRRALHLQEQRLEGFHPDVLTTLDNLAELYRVWGRYDEAESFGHRAREAQEQSLRTEHPRMASILNNLGELATVQGRYPEAEQHHRQALTIREKVLGQEHPETATTCNNLAELYRIVGRYTEAEPLYRRALQIWE
jgi:hypothetical protein